MPVVTERTRNTLWGGLAGSGAHAARTAITAAGIVSLLPSPGLPAAELSSCPLIQVLVLNTLRDTVRKFFQALTRSSLLLSPNPFFLGDEIVVRAKAPLDPVAGTRRAPGAQLGALWAPPQRF